MAALPDQISHLVQAVKLQVDLVRHNLRFVVTVVWVDSSHLLPQIQLLLLLDGDLQRFLKLAILEDVGDMRVATVL